MPLNKETKPNQTKPLFGYQPLWVIQCLSHLHVVYSYTCRCKQKHNYDFNERTFINFLSSEFGSLTREERDTQFLIVFRIILC